MIAHSHKRYKFMMRIDDLSRPVPHRFIGVVQVAVDLCHDLKVFTLGTVPHDLVQGIANSPLGVVELGGVEEAETTFPCKSDSFNLKRLQLVLTLNSNE